MSFYFLLSSILCFLITRLISFEAEMIPKIRSSSFSILFSLAVMLYRRELSGFDSVLLKLRGIFWLSRFVRGFVIENSLFSDNLCGKKSFGSFWCEIMIDRFILGDISSIGWMRERGMRMSEKWAILNKFNICNWYVIFPYYTEFIYFTIIQLVR